MATTKVAVGTMAVAQISKPGGDFEIVEREIPKPGVGEVLIKVQACGICHSDVLTKEGAFPGIQYPRVPGHEVAGTIDELGVGVPDGRRDNASASVGTAAMTAHVLHVGAEIFAIAGMERFRASATTADTSNIWWLPSRRWRRYRKA